MKIGDVVFVRGTVDEIRKDTIIIRNEGGYFGTVPSEVVPTIEERKTGKWIPHDVDNRGMTDVFRCDNCNVFTYIPILKRKDAMEYDFCPWCGADMREKKT